MNEQWVGFGLWIAGMALLVAVVVWIDKWFRERRKKSSSSPRKVEDSAKLAGLRQNLRLKVGYDEAKIDRLIGLERERMPHASTQALVEAAIERWERDNR